MSCKHIVTYLPAILFLEDEMSHKETLSYFEQVEDKQKLKQVAKYLRDRDCVKDAETFSVDDMQKDQWCELYPSLTKHVLYQAFIHVGEHYIARKLYPSGIYVYARHVHTVSSV